MTPPHFKVPENNSTTVVNYCSVSNNNQNDDDENQACNSSIFLEKFYDSERQMCSFPMSCIERLQELQNAELKQQSHLQPKQTAESELLNKNWLKDFNKVGSEIMEKINESDAKINQLKKEIRDLKNKNKKTKKKAEKEENQNKIDALKNDIKNEEEKINKESKEFLEKANIKNLYSSNPKAKRIYESWKDLDPTWLLRKQKFLIEDEKLLNDFFTENNKYRHKQETLSQKGTVQELMSNQDVMANIKSVIIFFEDGVDGPKLKTTPDNRQKTSLPHGIHLYDSNYDDVKAAKTKYEEEKKAHNGHLTVEEYAKKLNYKERFLLNSAFKDKGLILNKDDIEKMFNDTINECLADIQKIFGDKQLTAGQLIGLVDLRYNAGTNLFKNSNDIVKFMKEDDIQRACDKFLSYTKVDDVDNERKVKRRLYERALFTGSSDEILKASSEEIQQANLSKNNKKK